MTPKKISGIFFLGIEPLLLKVIRDFKVESPQKQLKIDHQKQHACGSSIFPLLSLLLDFRLVLGN
jgi:hypothetical protein